MCSMKMKEAFCNYAGSHCSFLKEVEAQSGHEQLVTVTMIRHYYLVHRESSCDFKSVWVLVECVRQQLLQTHCQIYKYTLSVGMHPKGICVLTFWQKCTQQISTLFVSMTLLEKNNHTGLRQSAFANIKNGHNSVDFNKYWVKLLG